MTTAPPPPAAPASRAWRAAAICLCLAAVAGITRMAWLGDDAFITFRSVENMVAGRGPVWNADDRVQTFTHPLWFGVLCLVRLITGELPLTAQVVGIALSLAALAGLVRTAGAAHAAAAALVLCLGSRAWVAYATSGLETSLTFVLLAGLVASLRSTDPDRRLRRTALMAGLLATNRLDLLLLCAPALGSSLRGVRRATALRALVFGMAPLAAWSAFATVYYGSPFPITAFAKAFCHGVPAGDLAAQGVRYLVRSATDDPVTPAAIGVAAVVGLVGRQRALALGMLLYTAYVVKIGGDYMLGRFFVPPFFVAAAVLGRAIAGAPRTIAAFAIGGTAALACVPGLPRVAAPWTGEALYSPGLDGIVDEQLRGQWDHGLVSPHRVVSVFGAHGEALRAEGLSSRMVTVWGSMGWTGFRAGTVAHYVDPWLCDPLIARLPVADVARWRIGHFYRNIPAGYLESLATGENRIPHPGLAALWEAVRSATRDPVWSSHRWGHLWDLWTGRLDAGLADYVATQYRTPPRIELALAEFAPPAAANVWWFDWPRARSAQTGGLSVRLPEPASLRSVIVHVSPGGYDVSFRRAGAQVGTGRILTAHGHERLLAQTVAVPDGTGPIDAIWIDGLVPLETPYTTIVGGVELLR